MSQRALADSQIQDLLTVGPFLGIDASTSKYFLDQFHANDSIAVVPNRSFLGYVTARGRVHAMASSFLSKSFGFTKYARSGITDLYIAAVNNGVNGALQVANLGASPLLLTLPVGVSLSPSLETSFVPFQQWLFLANGSNTPLKIDTNLTVTRWQMQAPSTVATANSFVGPDNTTLSLSLVAGTSDAHQIWVQTSYVDANGVESTAHDTNFSTITPLATQQAQIASPANPPAWAKKYNVYVTESLINGNAYLQNATPIALGTAYTIPGTPTTTTRQLPVWTGNLRGTYYWLVTFANGSQESSSGPVSAGTFFSNVSTDVSLGAISGPALLQNIPVSTDPQCTGRNIYRFGGSMQQIQLVGTITDNTSTFFIDNTADNSVTGATLVQHRDPPQPFFAIEPHKGRVWGFGYSGTAVGEPSSIQGTSDLWFSNYEEPWSFNSVTQVIPVGRNTGGDVAVEVKSLGSVLYLFKARSLWAVTGDTPQDFVQRRLFDVGCASKKSVVRAYGRLFWSSPEGAVYMFDGATLMNISDNRTVDAKSSIKGILDGFSSTDFASATGAAWDQTYLISFPTQNITFMYDIPSGQWYKLPWAFDRAYFDVENDNEVQAFEVGTGVLDTWFAAETDLGTAITSSYISRTTDSGVPQGTKRYRHAVVLAPVQPGATATITVTVDPGAGPKTNTRAVNLAVGPPSRKVSLPPNMVGSEVQVTISVTSTSRTELHRVSVYGWVERQFVSRG